MQDNIIEGFGLGAGLLLPITIIW